MAYFGVRQRYLSHNIIVKLHGPFDTIEINSIGLKNFIDERIAFYGDPFNIIDVANRLAQDAADKYCDGAILVWAEVEIWSYHGILYGTSAAKVEELCP